MLADTGKAQKARYMRVYMRSWRLPVVSAKNSVASRKRGTESRHKACTQCSVRAVPGKCGCDFEEFEKRVDKSVLKSFLRAVRYSQIRSYGSTADVGYWTTRKKFSSEVMQMTATFAFTQRQTETAWGAVKSCVQGRVPDSDAYDKP